MYSLLMRKTRCHNNDNYVILTVPPKEAASLFMMTSEAIRCNRQSVTVITFGVSHSGKRGSTTL